MSFVDRSVRIADGYARWTIFVRNCFDTSSDDIEDLVHPVGTRIPREEAERLGVEELRPGGADPAGSRPQSDSTKNRRDGRGGDADPELEQFASDPHVSPPRVLPPESDHQVPDLAVDRRPPRLAARAGGRPAPELPVPPEERLGAHQEAGPPLPREQAGGRSQERPVGRSVSGPLPQPGDHGDLVAKDRNLEVPFAVGASASSEQAHQPAEEPVDPRPERRGILAPETHLNNDAGHGYGSSFFTPQGTPRCWLLRASRQGLPTSRNGLGSSSRRGTKDRDQTPGPGRRSSG
jgi:hypothetical protein